MEDQVRDGEDQGVWLKVDRDVIKARIKTLKITIEQLADRAGVTSRTIYRARAGERLRVDKVQAIATALNVSLHTLVNGYDPPAVEPDRRERRYIVRIKIKTPHAKMENFPEVFGAKKDLLERLCESEYGIEIDRMEKGSTILVSYMRDSDILRLLAAMMDHSLGSLDIEGVEIPDHSWIMRMLAEIKKTGWPRIVDRFTWEEELNNRKMDFLRRKTKDCWFCNSDE